MSTPPISVDLIDCDSNFGGLLDRITKAVKSGEMVELRIDGIGYWVQLDRVTTTVQVLSPRREF
jgi:hypothetical protein